MKDETNPKQFKDNDWNPIKNSSYRVYMRKSSPSHNDHTLTIEEIKYSPEGSPTKEILTGEEVFALIIDGINFRKLKEAARIKKEFI